MKSPQVLFLFMAVFLVAITATTAPALSTGDVYAYWSFDETSGDHYYDSSGYGSTATFGSSIDDNLTKMIPVSDCSNMDASCATRTGATGTGTGMMLGYDQCLVNDTITTSLIDIPTIPAMGTDFAVSFWMSDDNWNTERGIIASYNDGDATTPRAFTIGVNTSGSNREVVVRSTLGSTSSYFTSDVTTLSGYHHILAQFNGATISNLYIDGVAATDTGHTGWGTPNTVGFNLGCRELSTSSSYPITGVEIDDFAVISGTVTSGQAYDIATAGDSIDTISGLTLNTHLKLDETTGSTLLDSSGNGNNGRLVQWSELDPEDVSNATTTGKFGAGAVFNRTDTDFAQFIPNNLPTVGEDAFTTTFWFKADDWTEGGTVLAWDNELNQFTIGFNTKGEFRTFLKGTDGQVIRWKDVDENGLNLTDGEFVHVAVTVDDNSNIQLYLNGVLQTLGTSSSTRPNALNTATIGTRNRENAVGILDSMSGALDDLAIFHGVLSQTEIECVMNHGVAASIPEPSTLVMLLGTLLGVLAIRRTR